MNEVKQKLKVFLGLFLLARNKMETLKLKIDTGDIDLTQLNIFLHGKRDFLVGLLENPVLIEHNGFSEALLAVFHLQDELNCRNDLIHLPNADRKHLTVDMNRAYGLLVGQWLVYLEHLKKQYPYIFSLAVRKNPFDPNASPVVMS